MLRLNEPDLSNVRPESMNNRSSSSPLDLFDAVLIVSFGGPQGPADVRPFLENVLRGRRGPPPPIEPIASKYQRLGGVSPLTALTRRQARGLHDRLQHRGIDLPVYVGMRHWHPFLTRVLCEMSQAAVRRAIGFIAAAHHAYASCGQYKQSVIDARHELSRRGLPATWTMALPLEQSEPLLIGWSGSPSTCSSFPPELIRIAPQPTAQ